mmetsp:Transcript_6331/g.15702  ORF Transcript_6331/g.15702 Transcript_6331/m.15702 type:complete len:203 (-) Transcript_6331:313-921(-)
MRSWIPRDLPPEPRDDRRAPDASAWVALIGRSPGLVPLPRALLEVCGSSLSLSLSLLVVLLAFRLPAALPSSPSSSASSAMRNLRRPSLATSLATSTTSRKGSFCRRMLPFSRIPCRTRFISPPRRHSRAFEASSRRACCSGVRICVWIGQTWRHGGSAQSNRSTIGNPCTTISGVRDCQTTTTGFLVPEAPAATNFSRNAP